MTDVTQYSYSTPLSYEPAQRLSYTGTQPEVAIEEPPRKRRKMSPDAKLGIAGAVVGGVAGGLIGSRQNPYMRNGIPTDTFTRKAYDKYIEVAPDDVKKSYNQFKEVINKLDGIKTTDELKTLMSNNPEAKNKFGASLTGTTADAFLDAVTDTTIGQNKETIKKEMESAINTNRQNMKNKIHECWDAEKKQFIKPDSMEENIFNSIKNTSGKVKAGFIAKWVAISAAVVGIGAVVIRKIVKHKKEATRQ